MSAVTDQPHRFGGLERERHIRMVYRAFHRCWGGRAGLQGSTTSLCPERGVLAGHADPGSQAVVLHQGEEGPSGIAGPGVSGLEMDIVGQRDCWQEPDTARGLTALSTVSRLHITTKPQLRGMAWECTAEAIIVCTCVTTQLRDQSYLFMSGNTVCSLGIEILALFHLLLLL